VLLPFPICLSSSLRGRHMTSLVCRSSLISNGRHNGSYKKTPVIYIMQILTKIFVLASLPLPERMASDHKRDTFLSPGNRLSPV
jgi:hypothetical protein